MLKNKNVWEQISPLKQHKWNKMAEMKGMATINNNNNNNNSDHKVTFLERQEHLKKI